MTNSLLQYLGRLLKGPIFSADYVLNNGIGAMNEPADHRTRGAAKPRERLFSGLILASEKPAKEISIEEVYTHAETSRGTFYKYFTGATGLFKAKNCCKKAVFIHGAIFIQKCGNFCHF